MLTIGVDIDGVLADFNSSLAGHISGFGHEKDRGRHFPVPSGWNFEDWDLNKSFPEYYRDFVKAGGYRNMALSHGAVYVLSRAQDLGHKVVLITNRGASGKLTDELNAVAVSDTVFWLGKNKVPYDSLCFVESKAVVCPDIMIEDAPDNINQLVSLNRELIILHHAYNQNLFLSGLRTNVRRAYNWHDVMVHLDRFDEENKIPF